MIFKSKVESNLPVDPADPINSPIEVSETREVNDNESFAPIKIFTFPLRLKKGIELSRKNFSNESLLNLSSINLWSLNFFI